MRSLGTIRMKIQRFSIKKLMLQNIARSHKCNLVNTNSILHKYIIIRFFQEFFDNCHWLVRLTVCFQNKKFHMPQYILYNKLNTFKMDTTQTFCHKCILNILIFFSWMLSTHPTMHEEIPHSPNPKTPTRYIRTGVRNQTFISDRTFVL